MMFSSRRRNKSSVSERSGFLGFMNLPPLQVAEEENLYSLKAANRRSQIARFSTSQRGILAIPTTHPDQRAQPPQSLRWILTDDDLNDGSGLPPGDERDLKRDIQ